MGNAYGKWNQTIFIQDGKRDPFSGSKHISVKDSIRYGCVLVMVIKVVKFSSGRYKIRKIFASESTYPKEINEF